jgi:hypothetical protein
MLQTHSRKLAALAGLALLLVLGSPAVAQIPNRLHTPKVCSPCHHPYFGYYPTCWRPFPPGWYTCPYCPPPADTGSRPPGAQKPPDKGPNGNGAEQIPPPTPITRRFLFR